MCVGVSLEKYKNRMCDFYFIFVECRCFVNQNVRLDVHFVFFKVVDASYQIKTIHGMYICFSTMHAKSKRHRVCIFILACIVPKQNGIIQFRRTKARLCVSPASPVYHLRRLCITRSSSVRFAMSGHIHVGSRGSCG